MTINGAFEAGLYQVFDGDGNVSFGSSSSVAVYPQWFGATGDGTHDDTSAFEKALQSSKTLYLPLTSGAYVVNDLSLSNGTTIIGENRNVKIKHTTGQAVFKVTSVYDLKIENLTCISGSGYFFLQTDRSNFTAYAIFRNIETYATLDAAYYGFFIMTVWDGGRDGYSGTQNTNHCFIRSIPSDDQINGVSVQHNQTNLCLVKDVYIFRAGANAEAAIELEYGHSWHITGCNFELLNTYAIKARGILSGMVIERNWFEAINNAGIISFGNSRGLNVQGVQAVVRKNTINAQYTTNYILNMSGTTGCVFTENFIQRLQSGTTLKSSGGNAYFAELNNFFAASDSGAISTFKSTTNPIVQLANTNLLPFGRNGVPSTKWTTTGSSGSVSSVSSNMGLDNQVTRYNIGLSANYAYYRIPDKLLKVIKNKNVSLSMLVYGGGVVYGTTIWAAVWIDVTPNQNNATAMSQHFDPSVTTPTVLNANVGIPSGATDVYIGVAAEGATSHGSYIVIEALELYIGYHYNKTYISLI